MEVSLIVIIKLFTTSLPTFPIEILIDSGMGLSITMDKFRVFINKTLSTQSLINKLLIKRVGLSMTMKSVCPRHNGKCVCPGECVHNG